MGINRKVEMRKLKVGVIGLKMGYSHLLGYRDNPNAEIKGVCDLDSSLLEKAAKEFKPQIVTSDYRDLLKAKEIDAISVATPDALHKEQSVEAMKAGKHVLCEKPMALSLEECKEIVKTAEQTKTKFMIGQICRFTTAFKLAKKLIGEGEIGDLFYVESEYAHYYGFAEGVGGWRKSGKILREPFLGGGCHAVDLLRWIAGDAEESFAYANHKCLSDWPVDDCTIASYRFKNGIIGKVFVSIGCTRPYTMRSCFY